MNFAIELHALLADESIRGQALMRRYLADHAAEIEAVIWAADDVDTDWNEKSARKLRDALIALNKDCDV